MCHKSFLYAFTQYKTPKSFDFVVDMPRHETGKLYKRKLRDPYWEGTGRLI